MIALEVDEAGVRPGVAAPERVGRDVGIRVEAEPVHQRPLAPARPVPAAERGEEAHGRGRDVAPRERPVVPARREADADHGELWIHRLERVVSRREERAEGAGGALARARELRPPERALVRLVPDDELPHLGVRAGRARPARRRTPRGARARSRSRAADTGTSRRRRRGPRGGRRRRSGRGAAAPCSASGSLGLPANGDRPPGAGRAPPSRRRTTPRRPPRTCPCRRSLRRRHLRRRHRRARRRRRPQRRSGALDHVSLATRISPQIPLGDRLVVAPGRERLAMLADQPAAARTASSSGSAVVRTGSHAGRPVSAAALSTAAAASSSSSPAVFTATATTRAGRRGKRGALVQRDELRERGDRVARRALDLGRARAVAEDERVRHRAVEEPERHARVGRMDERPLALDEEQLAAAAPALDDEALRGAGEKVGDDGVDGDPPPGDRDARSDPWGRTPRRGRVPSRRGRARARPSSSRSRSPSRR